MPNRVAATRSGLALDWRSVAQSLVVASLLAIATAAIQTWFEVRMLRHDVERIEGVLDNLVDEVGK